jgi:hypothetical protein
MIATKTIDQLMRLMTSDMLIFNRKEAGEMIEISLILLNNITKLDAGVRDLLQETEEEYLHGFYISKLTTLFFDPNMDDQTRWIGNIFTNVTRVEFGRKVFMAQNINQKLIPLICDKNELKRSGILKTFINLLHRDGVPKELISGGVLDYIFSQVQKEPIVAIRRLLVECIYLMVDVKDVLGQKKYTGVFQRLMLNEPNEEIKELMQRILKHVGPEEDGQYLRFENVPDDEESKSSEKTDEVDID